MPKKIINLNRSITPPLDIINNSIANNSIDNHSFNNQSIANNSIANISIDEHSIDNQSIDNQSIANNSISSINDSPFIVGVKNYNDSSSENNSISLNDINFNIERDNFDDNFYSIDELNDYTCNIYNILSKADMIIFIDNNLMINQDCHLFKRNNFIKNEKFNGCTFLPFEYMNYIKKYIHELNTVISNNSIKNIKIKSDNDYCHNIYFEDGDIKKNVVYKKMEIMNKYLFIPLNKYSIKQTEYKIRGFCQIAEELGAKKIEVKFYNSNTNSVTKKFDSSIGVELDLFAGGLGLISNNNSNENEEQSYVLEYPSINTISLNEASILKKIRGRKFIISENMYNSNLELQYLVNSRCRHFITNYSTVFNLDSDLNINKSLHSKFKSHGIDIGLNHSNDTKKTNNIKIITNISFSSQEDYYNNLGGHSVSLDRIGFNYLIESFNNNNDQFKSTGIYKIMTFIDLYIDKVIKHEKKERYKFIKNLMIQIKKNLSLSEYAEILCNYFDCSSQWIHFKYFIDLLSNRTQSCDKLGYLIIINDNDSEPIDKINNIIRFIQEYCVKLNIEKNFWEMLKPHRRDIRYLLRDKFYKEYDVMDFFNWYGINNIINNIKNYPIDLGDDDDTIFKNLIKRMNNGYGQIEFYDNILPFILRYYSKNIYTNNFSNHLILLEESITYESFIIAKINNLNNLEEYLKNKNQKIEMMYSIIDTFKNNYYNIEKPTDNGLYYLFNKFIETEFENKYKYFYKKYKIIISNENNIEYFNDSIQNILKKLLLYNDKLNINNIPLNTFGFELVKKNYNYGNKKNEFNNILKFIKKLIKNIIENNFRYNSNEYNILVSINFIEHFTLNDFDKNNYNFYDIIKKIKFLIEDYSPNINLKEDIINNLCFS